jgi:chromosome segregation ATPase
MIAVVMVAAAVSASGRSPALQAQSPAAASNQDVLPALLVEVRGLRAAMEQMASAGPRVQLFVSRLQLQENRINGMVRRLDDIRDRLVAAQRVLGESQQEQTRVENAINNPGNAMHRDDFVGMLAQTKNEITDRKAAVARLIAEETQLTSDITAEQARWTEINQRLDELERALVKR